jgi:predicted phosphate transport protein (TIGR00153 family)
MRIDTIIQKLLPRDDKFFVLLEQSMKNLVRASQTLQKMNATTMLTQRTAIAKELQDLEHEGDALTHTIFSELNSTFVTPFDREDIHLLASALDDICDYIDGAASRMVLYRINKIPEPMKQLIDVLALSVLDLEKGVHLLRHLNRFDELREVFKSVNDYENQADTIFENAVADLFKKEKNAITVIKVKELLVGLETATDKCEDAANVLESILIKHN